MKVTIKQIQTELRAAIKPGKAEILSRFFKTGPGQYGEGDKFLGVMVPEIRQIAKCYRQLDLAVVAELLSSAWHEERMTGALILTYAYEQADELGRAAIFAAYLDNRRGINNWDLVDLSADRVVGAWLYQYPNPALLDKLVKSDCLWDRRIAMLSSFYFLKQGQSQLTYKLAKKLINDQHDLMHKAVGWMLREAGKRVDQDELEAFLDVYGSRMPRTMLRYAIERLPETRRQFYLKK